MIVTAATQSSDVGPTQVIAIAALIVAFYSAFLATRTSRWQRRRDEEKLRSDITIGLAERRGLGGGGELIIGETRLTEHVLTVRVMNGGESPEYVREVHLETERPQPLTVKVRPPKGTTEVRPRDEATFALELTGSQAFPWSEPFVAVVELANGQVFRSSVAPGGPQPQHGLPVVIPNLYAEDAESAGTISPGDDRVARWEPTDARGGPKSGKRRRS